MIVFEGFTKTGSKKTLSLSSDQLQLIYQLDGIYVDSYTILNAIEILKELNNIVHINEFNKTYMMDLLGKAESEGVTLKEIRGFYDVLSEAVDAERKVKKDEDIDSLFKSYPEERKCIVYRNKDALLADLRLHLDDVYNQFVKEKDIIDCDWFDWDNALYTSSNYLDAYLNTIPQNRSIVLSCAFVNETCEDTVKKQYEDYKQKEIESCIRK